MQFSSVPSNSLVEGSLRSSQMNKSIDFGTVADLYDVYVQWEVDIPFFRELSADATGEVLELMSGTGRLSIPLLQHGVRLCCVDYSAEMLEVLKLKLRKYNLTADVHEQDVRTLALGRSFELILLPFHSLSEVIEFSDRVRALHCIRRHLAPGGRVVITLHNPTVQLPRLDMARAAKSASAPCLTPLRNCTSGTRLGVRTMDGSAGHSRSMKSQPRTDGCSKDASCPCGLRSSIARHSKPRQPRRASRCFTSGAATPEVGLNPRGART